ncbi:hypothetical protein AB0J28_49225, partial [Streptosporangium canum]|uniref:hypothetical protein n=1 Tax=Streptosporangium canum TaxID=324952 RepID=UPI003434E5DB
MFFHVNPLVRGYGEPPGHPESGYSPPPSTANSHGGTGPTEAAGPEFREGRGREASGVHNSDGTEHATEGRDRKANGIHNTDGTEHATEGRDRKANGIHNTDGTEHATEGRD